jgi:hypothetical protein
MEDGGVRVGVGSSAVGVAGVDVIACLRQGGTGDRAVEIPDRVGRGTEGEALLSKASTVQNGLVAGRSAPPRSSNSSSASTAGHGRVEM